jgi:hypothetical protein
MIMCPTPGIIYALCRPTHPGLTDEIFNEWYNDVHLRDVVNTGLVDLALRYKSCNADSKYPYLAIYRVPDMTVLQSPEGMAKLMAIPTRHDSLPDGKSWNELVGTERGFAKRVQTYDEGATEEGQS